ncbi:MAG: hypothetical protein PHD61_10350 [Bacteroidales bacterium]|nr:hypothetical protein [Lentimicrobiaceae bacterium]MDD5695686.1 hypothetical protein [Bacteroidales bacterium]
MHDIEPFYAWRHEYIASEDEWSPFYGREYSEFEFSNCIYNYYIHPQWDEIGSPTLYIKLLYTDYDRNFCVIELLGEWNDAIHNDIMYLKRNVIEHLTSHQVTKFILIGENVLNFHFSDEEYYQEWSEEIEDGWIVAINFHEHVLREFNKVHINHYISCGGKLNSLEWRTFSPQQLYEKVSSLITKRLPK